MQEMVRACQYNTELLSFLEVNLDTIDGRLNDTKAYDVNYNR